MTIVQKIEDLLTAPLFHKGYAIVRVKISGEKRPTLQIMIERLDDQPLVVDDCAEASYTISALMDVENLMKGQYVLEVSSPGLDRPLVKVSDYKKFLGQNITVKTIQSVNNRKNFSGKLESAKESAITIKLEGLPKAEEVLVELEYANIHSARLKAVI
mgnify:CR=1 FL=1